MLDYNATVRSLWGEQETELKAAENQKKEKNCPNKKHDQSVKTLKAQTVCKPY